MSLLVISVAVATLIVLAISFAIGLSVRYLTRTKDTIVKPPFEDWGDWGRN